MKNNQILSNNDSVHSARTDRLLNETLTEKIDSFDNYFIG